MSGFCSSRSSSSSRPRYGSAGVAATLAGPTSPEFLRGGASRDRRRADGERCVRRAAGWGFHHRLGVGPGAEQRPDAGRVRPTAALKAQTTSGVVSTPIFHPAGASFIGFALGPPVTRPGSAIYLQLPIDPAAAASAPVTRSQPFNELDVALYVGARPNPRQLALATAPAPLAGDVAYRRISVGGRKWTLAASATSRSSARSRTPFRGSSSGLASRAPRRRSGRSSRSSAGATTRLASSRSGQPSSRRRCARSRTAGPTGVPGAVGDDPRRRPLWATTPQPPGRAHERALPRPQCAPQRPRRAGNPEPGYGRARDRCDGDHRRENARLRGRPRAAGGAR